MGRMEYSISGKTVRICEKWMIPKRTPRTKVMGQRRDVGNGKGIGLSCE
jgi:hypothetical protein